MEEDVLTFNTTHCSYYVLLEEGEAPKNYLWIYILVACVLVLIIGATVAIIIVKKRNANYKKMAEENSKKDYVTY